MITHNDGSIEIEIPDLHIPESEVDSITRNFLHSRDVKAIETKIEDLTGNIITVANRKIDEITVLSGRVVINVPLSYELKVGEYKKVMVPYNQLDIHNK